jgi:FAD/FMN-containing dehydrogenase
MESAPTLSELIGDGKITRRDAVLEQYSRDVSFSKAMRPDSVVRPTDVADVETIVRFAGETSTPLVPVSSGPPHFRGDTVPSVGGAMIIDLSGLKKIVRIDRLNRVAMVEPGVTFAEVLPELERAGLRLNMPLLPRTTKSVVGSLLEREPVIMPGYHWDIADPLDCVEVVFGTGDRFRTGSAAGPGGIEEQLISGGAQDEPLGPGQTSWHRALQGAQGTLGVVTWATMRCELLPKLEEPFMVGSPQPEALLELANWLIRLRLVNECFVLNDVNLSAMFAEGGFADYRDIRNTLPPWVLFFNVAGYNYLPEERVAYQTEDALKAAQRMALETVKKMGQISAAQLLRAARRPSEEPYWKVRRMGASEDVFFLTTYDKIPGLTRTMFALADQTGYPATEVGVYLQPVVQGTSCHCEFNLAYRPEDPGDTERVKLLSRRATMSLMNMGAFFSRPYGENARKIVNRDGATVAALRKIKAIFDPKNIMNPGKLCF